MTHVMFDLHVHVQAVQYNIYVGFIFSVFIVSSIKVTYISVFENQQTTQRGASIFFEF